MNLPANYQPGTILRTTYVAAVQFPEFVGFHASQPKLGDCSLAHGWLYQQTGLYLGFGGHLDNDFREVKVSGTPDEPLTEAQALEAFQILEQLNHMTAAEFEEKTGLITLALATNQGRIDAQEAFGRLGFIYDSERESRKSVTKAIYYPEVAEYWAQQPLFHLDNYDYNTADAIEQVHLVAMRTIVNGAYNQQGFYPEQDAGYYPPQDGYGFNYL